ncbi:MAG: phosphoribosylanthranilate isomerase [Marinoscillum sp.]
MSLKTFVKIGKIENLSDARYCAGMMADILGFNLEEGTTGYVSPEKFSEISEWVAGVKFCGEFGLSNPADIKLATTQYALDLIEVQTIEQLEELSDLGISMIFKKPIVSIEDLETLDSVIQLAGDHATYIIIHSSKKELTPAIDKKITELEINTSILRSYDLHPDSIGDVIATNEFHGIELEGSPEDRPGFKDYGVVMDILEELEEE